MSDTTLPPYKLSDWLWVPFLIAAALLTPEILGHLL